MTKYAISLGTVNFNAITVEYLQKIMETKRVGQGSLISEFEEALKSFFQVKHAIVVANGTAACAIALSTAKYLQQSDRDEVILPALTFIAQANAVLQAGLKPVFVDAGDDYQIDPNLIAEKINERTLAIMPAHIFGRPANMEQILPLARQHGLFVVEDACDAIGSQLNGCLAGTMGDAGCLSFYVSHTIAAGEGGALLTNNDDIAHLAKSLRNHGRKSDALFERFAYDQIGFSAKMNQMEAAVGLGSICEIDTIIKRRRYNLDYLNQELGDLFVGRENEFIVPHCYPIMLDSEAERNDALVYLDENRVEVRTIYPCIPTQTKAYTFMNQKPGAYPKAEEMGRRGLYVPCHQNLTDENLECLAGLVKHVLHKDVRQPV